MTLIDFIRLLALIVSAIGLFWVLANDKFPDRMIVRSVFAVSLSVVFWGIYDRLLPLVDGTVFDDHNKPYMEILDMKPMRYEAAAGDEIPTSFTVRKRPGCAGTVKIKMVGPVNYTLREGETGWPEGQSMQVVIYKIPDGAPAGKYRLFFTARVKCGPADGFKATSPGTQLRYTSPSVNVRVRP